MDVVIRSIWWIRNWMAFDKFKPDLQHEIQNIKIRLGYWIKGWCDKFPYNPDFLLSNLDQVRRWHE